MKPVLKYPGAKWRLAPWISQYIPPHESYLEPYFGSGAVFFNKPKSRIETVNDIDGAIVQFFRTCREHPVELADAIRMTPWAREEFMAAAFLPNSADDIERARQFAICCWMSFGARTEGKKSFRATTGARRDGGPDNPKLWNRLPDVVLQVAERLKDAQIENRPALDLIRAYDGRDVLIYADPPYLKATRTKNGDQYRNEMSDADHQDMLQALLRHSGPVLLSGYDNDMYRDVLADWTVIQKHTTAERGAKRTECLWLNQATVERLERTA